MMRKIALAIVLAAAAFAGFGAISKQVTIGDVTFYYQIPNVGTFAVVSSVSLNEPGPVVIPAEIEGDRSGTSVIAWRGALAGHLS